MDTCDLIKQNQSAYEIPEPTSTTIGGILADEAPVEYTTEMKYNKTTKKLYGPKINDPKTYNTIVIGNSISGHTLKDCDYLCDGNQDNIEIQQAIDAANEGDNILILPGKYVAVSTINMNKRNITLSGMNGRFNDDLTNIVGTHIEFTNKDEKGFYITKSINTIKDITIESVPDTSFLVDTSNIHIEEGVVGTKILDCYVYSTDATHKSFGVYVGANSTEGIEINPPTIISGCRFDNIRCIYISGSATNKCKDVIIEKNTTYNASEFVFISYSNRITLRDNTAITTGINTVIEKSDNILIDNCVIDSVDDEFFISRISGNRNVKITNSKLVGYFQFIYCDNLYIDHTNFATGSKISFPNANRLILSDCTIDCEVLMDSTTDVSIENNIIVNLADKLVFGLSLSNVTQTKLLNNTFYIGSDCMGAAQIENITYSNISNNIVKFFSIPKDSQMSMLIVSAYDNIITGNYFIDKNYILDGSGNIEANNKF